MPQIQPIVLVSPGFLGLNRERQNNLLDQKWATEALNCVLTRPGRIAARNGYAVQTSTAITGAPAIESLHEYVQDDGTVELIIAWDGGIANDIDDPEGNDISGSVTDTSGRWFFQNFNDKCIGFQSGQKPIVYNGTGNFATVSESSGTAPDGGIGTCAFGRVWCVDGDRKTIQYSGLLDETDWGGSGAGSIDMSNIWTAGTDQVTAISALGGSLIVFGRKHIVVFTTGQGSDIGLVPNDLYVTDTIEGTGCLSQFTVQRIGEGDLWYLSPNGVQSFKRALVQKSNPIETVTGTIKSYLLELIDTQRAEDADFNASRSAFSPNHAFYLLSLPETGRIICVDTRRPIPDDEGRLTYASTEWQVTGSPSSFATRRNGDLLFGLSGEVAKYSGFDDDGEAIEIEFYTGWLDLGEGNQYLKYLKELSVIVEVTGGVNISWRWEWDFTGRALTRQVNIQDPGRAEYGVSEYGTNGSLDPDDPAFTAGTDVSEYSGGLSIQRKTFPGRGQGQFIRVGYTAPVDGGGLVLQQIQLIPKFGRLAA